MINDFQKAYPDVGPWTLDLGLRTTTVIMAFILDDILFSPLKFTIWLGEKLKDAAFQEMTDESKIHEGLLQLQMRFEMDEISEDEYAKEEGRLMEQLETIRKMKEEG